jgi:GNAT superfamily N-acetyltransferase
MRDIPMIHLTEEPVGDLRQYAIVASGFESRIMFDAVRTRGGLDIVERQLAAPYRKSFDDFEDPIVRGYDTRNWALISAFAGDERIGGLILAAATPGVTRLEDRPDLAVVWDMRVAPRWRRKTVGTAMLYAARVWAWQHGCRELKAETQNTNEAACRFFSHHGFVLGDAVPVGHPQLPKMMQLVWRKRLDD